MVNPKLLELSNYSGNAKGRNRFNTTRGGFSGGRGGGFGGTGGNRGFSSNRGGSMNGRGSHAGSRGMSGNSRGSSRSSGSFNKSGPPPSLSRDSQQRPPNSSGDYKRYVNTGPPPSSNSGRWDHSVTKTVPRSTTIQAPPPTRQQNGYQGQQFNVPPPPIGSYFHSNNFSQPPPSTNGYPYPGQPPLPNN